MTLLETIDSWKFIAGLGIFLLAMSFLEESLKELAGRKFKTFIREFTKTPLRGVFSGTFATSLLQSSSVVTLMVLSFVGAGIISMPNALGVIFGANLGTTLTGWIVALIGFKFSLESFTLPLIGIGALLYTILPKGKTLSQVFRFLASLGLLFLGLEFMKSSMAEISTQIDISILKGYSLAVYFIFGYLFTAVIQSSSATIVITLTALNAGLFELPSAAALVIGADLGTTTTALLGGFGGSPAKKQTAFAHFSFNLVTDLIALILLQPLLSFVHVIFADKNPLLSLVLFHTSFNILGIMIFLPFTKAFANFLEGRFGKSGLELVKYINKVSPQVTEAALEALTKEFDDLSLDIRNNNLAAFGLKTFQIKYAHTYEQLKERLGDILEYLLSVQEQPVTKQTSKALNQLLKALDHFSRSAKSAKDIHHNMSEFESSARPKIIEFQQKFNKPISQIYQQISEISQYENQSHIFEEINHLTQLNNDAFDNNQRSIYQTTSSRALDEKSISTLLNVNREIHSSTQYFLLGLKDILLTPEKSEEI